MPAFDRKKLCLKPLSERNHDLTVSIVKELDTHSASPIGKNTYAVARDICSAKENSHATIMLIGGHVIRTGVQKYIIDLMERGYISCLAMNGAGIIHDFEFALIGATTESVARYIKDGQFGLWQETARLNDIMNEAYRKDKSAGMGESVGRAISLGDFPCKEISLLAAGYRLSIPITVHVGIGYDIIHEYPNCDGAVTGATSYNDFLTFAEVVQNLESGVVMNFGSAVMAPEVFLKALSMARNIAHKEGRVINHFTTLVCDLMDLPDDFNKEPSRDNPAYYFRPWKTMLVRTVADGGISYYIKGKHSETIPELWSAINEEERR
ncbi:MAG: deoxyhypusine synthase family protein [Candidatus Scalindua sp.]|nr:deoxyhypusine synthase family protein [Candidatus Scalindua sp.]